MTLLFGAISHGLARTFFSGNNQALLYESLEELWRKEDFSVVSWKIESLKELALWSTALMWSIIAWYYSLWVLFWITTLPLLACIAVACMITEPSKYSKQINNNIFIHTKEAIKVFLWNSKLKRVSLASSLDYAVSEALFNFIPAFIATLWSTSMVGIYRFLLHIFWFIGFYFSWYIIKKYGELRSLYIFSSVESIFVVIAIIIGNIFSPILLSVSTLNYGIKTTSVQAIMQREFSSNKRATMGSINALLGTLLLALIFLILWFLADTIWVLQTFLLAQLVLVVPLMIYYKLFSTHERT